MKGLTTMYGYQYKKVGVAVSLIGMAGMIAERLKGFVILHKFNPQQHYAIFEWVLLAGLLGIIFCKEKYDDERAQAIRLKSYQVSFTIMQSVTLAAALMGQLFLHLDGMDSQLLFDISAIGIFLYLLLFYTGLYFDFLWEYNDKGLWENLRNVKKNVWGMLAYFVLSAIMLILVNLIALI